MGKTIVDISTNLERIDTTLDNVVMPLVLETVENGRSLDVAGFKGSFIRGVPEQDCINGKSIRFHINRRKYVRGFRKGL